MTWYEGYATIEDEDIEKWREDVRREFESYVGFVEALELSDTELDAVMEIAEEVLQQKVEARRGNEPHKAIEEFKEELNVFDLATMHAWASPEVSEFTISDREEVYSEF